MLGVVGVVGCPNVNEGVPAPAVGAPVVGVAAVFAPKVNEGAGEPVGAVVDGAVGFGVPKADPKAGVVALGPKLNEGAGDLVPAACPPKLKVVVGFVVAFPPPKEKADGAPVVGAPLKSKIFCLIYA